MASIAELKRQIALKQQLRDEEKTNADLRKQYHQEMIDLEQKLANQQKRNADRRKAKAQEVVRAEKSVTDEIKKQTEFRKGTVKIDKELQKVQSDILKSNQGIVSSLLKGNIAGILQKNVSKSTLTLQEKHLSARAALNQTIETSNIKDIQQKVAVQKIGQDIEDGLVDQQEVKDRIRAIDGLSIGQQIKFGTLLDKQFVSREKRLETEKEAEAAQDRINRANAKLVGVFGLLAAAAKALQVHWIK